MPNKPLSDLEQKIASHCESKFYYFLRSHSSTTDYLYQVLNWLDKIPDCRLLDLGAGIGKFCFIIDAFSDARVTGVENSRDLFKEIEKLNAIFPENKVHWIEGDFLSLDFQDYNCFYFFNSFFEQKVNHGTKVRAKYFDKDNFDIFNKALVKKLSMCKKSTLLITNQGFPEEIESVYVKKSAAFNDELILWERV